MTALDTGVILVVLGVLAVVGYVLAMVALAVMSARDRHAMSNRTKGTR